MNPETEDLDVKDTHYRKEDGTWSSLKEIDMTLEKFKEENVMKAFPDALSDEGSLVYVRNLGGRLQWMRANIHGGEEKWQELTPTIAKHLENGGKRKTSMELLIEKAEQEEILRKIGLQSKKYQAGWYQDDKGNLYQHDGTFWLNAYPTHEEADKFEYLG